MQLDVEEYLVRHDSKVLGMVGAGHQSAFQLRAAVAQRNFEKVVAWNYHPDMLANLEKVANELGLPFESVEREQLGAEADVIITIASAYEPQIKHEWIKPGTHLACMGTDTKNKQEVDIELVTAATVFTDEIAQSISIGEVQHAYAAGTISEKELTSIGEVINKTKHGRQSETEITLFDGTGVGLQDLAVASVAAQQQGKTTYVTL